MVLMFQKFLDLLEYKVEQVIKEMNKNFYLQRISEYINKHRKEIYIILTFLISIILSIRPIPSQIDDQNYINYVLFGDELLNNTLKSLWSNPLFLFVNEPIWLFVNVILGFLFSPETVLRIIIFTSTFLVLYSLGKFSNYSLWFPFFFVFLYQITKNHIVHLRQGFGLGIYLLGFISQGRKGTILKLISPLIHSSFYFLLAFNFFDFVGSKLRLTTNRKLIFFIISNVILLGLLPIILMITGDRRLGLYSFGPTSSGSSLGFLWWLVVGILFYLTKNREKNKNFLISLYGILFYLISYYFVDFGARVFENILPLLIADIIKFEKNKYIFIPVMILYGMLQWLFMLI